MKVRDIMEKNPITFRPSDTLHKALEAFTKQGISGAPVVSKGRLVGIVSELDVIKVLDIYTPRVHFSSMPQFFPVLPTPLITSSTISKTSYSSQISRMMG